MNLSPLPLQKFFDNAGMPLNGGKLFTYVAGTTTKLATYQDQAGTPNTNPVVLNFRGEANVWLDQTLTYKFVLAPANDTDPPTSPIWTVDNISAGITFASLTQQILGRILWPQTADEVLANVVPVNYFYEPGNIRRYGAVVDGATDDSAAIRKALDLAAQDGTPVTCAPAGPIKVSSVIYIPQTVGSVNFEMRLRFSGCIFIGQGRGTGTIFESGTGSVSTGGATNFGQPNESAASLHYHTVIEGALFTACSTAIRWFNFIYGCELRDCRFENVDRALYALRCFASRYYNNDAQIGGLTGGNYVFQFDSVNNAIVVQGCSAAGSAGGVTGIGFGFTGAGAGILFTGNTAENIDIGLFLGAIQGMLNKGNYYEQINTRAIDATSASNREMDIDDNWFLNCTQVISAILWIAGKFGAANHIQGAGSAVVINDVNSFCTVEIPPQSFSEATSLASAVLVPANYTLSGTVQLVARRFVFAAAGGFGNRLAVDLGDNKVTPPFAYSGGPASDGAGYWLPFATQTNSLASSTIDTQIRWATYMMECVFDLYGDIGGGGNIRLYGFVFGNNTVFRCDGSTATWTVTASNNAGLLRLTIGGSALAGKTMTGWLGAVRHM